MTRDKPSPPALDPDQTAVVEDPRSLWRNRDYLLLWSGQAVSTLGSGVSGLAFPLLVLTLTHSPGRTGLAAALFGLPYIVFSLPAGVLVDRWNRKRVMIVSDALRAVNMASIPAAAALGHLTLAQIYLAAVIEGTAFVFFNVAEVAALPRVVSSSQLPQAASQNQAAQTGAGLVSPPLGGLLFQAVSQTAPFLLDALSYGVSVLSLLAVRVPFQLERAPGDRHLWHEIGQGVAWLWHQPLIRYMTIVSGVLNFCNNALILVLLILAQQQGASPAFIGGMFAISAFGGFIGALVAPRIQQRFGYRQVIVTTVWIGALVVPFLAVAPNTVALGALMGLGFLVAPIYTTVQFSHRIALIPDALQGRVNSAVRMFAFGMIPLGSALGGLVIQTWGARATVLTIAAIELGLAGLTTVNRHIASA